MPDPERNDLPDATGIEPSERAPAASNVSPPLARRAWRGLRTQVKSMYLRLPASTQARVMRRLNTTRRHRLARSDVSTTHDLDGRADWARRWEQTSGPRVLMLAKKDYSGSMLKWARAVNEHTDIAVRLVTMQTHEYGYDNDLVLGWPPQPHLLATLLQDADIIHLKDETGFYDGNNLLPHDILRGRPVVFTHYGGFARKHADDPAYRRFVQRMDARIAMTPDLNYSWFDGAFIPHTVDTDRFPYLWDDSPVGGHSPSTSARKGTEEFLAAVTVLQESGTPVTVDLIEGVSHVECLARKARCGWFFDQAGSEVRRTLGTTAVIGWYGNSALEAAVHGIPTFAHLSPQAFEGARRAGKDIRSVVAIQDIPRDRDGMASTIREFLASPPDERRELSERTRRWVVDFHSPQVVADELAQVYATLI